jgi:predicted regulator of Ras-like GTPase activity (Roadblock/LC7/MglB family)
MSDAVPSRADVKGETPPGLEPPPLQQLFALVQRGASGELVCSCANAEIHVYLQGGRVAWASDSIHRHAFTRYLKEHARLDEASIDAVLGECRRTKRPIGETLMTWNLATRDDVRAAIRHQMMLALQFFQFGCDDPHAVFLERTQYRRYDPSLTFHLSELIPEGLASGETQSDASSLRLVSEPEPRNEGSLELGPHPDRPTEDVRMKATDKLKELQALDGFSGAALFTPTGEQLVMLEGDAQRLKEVGILANNVLLNSQKASLEMGAGRGQQVHVEGEKAHILVRCLNEGTDPIKSQPGKAHIHLVLVLKNDSAIGLAKMRMNATIQQLAEEFRM